MTAAEYIAQAVARSYRNRGEVLADDATELLLQLSLQFRGYFGLAAGLNPAVFGRQALLAWDAGNGRWNLPADCDTIYLLEQNGAEVFLVPFRDRAAEPSEPCVYQLGRALYKAGQSTDPNSAALTIWYAAVPADFTLVTDSPPAEWVPQYDQMVVDELALWLATKDGRADDIAALAPSVGRWMEEFTAWLGRQGVPLIQRFGMPTTVPTQTIVGKGVKGDR